MPTPAISLQLYSLREAIAADAPAAIARAANAGFRLVEPFALAETAAVIGPLLRANGLSAPTAHARVLGLEQAPTFEAAAALGVVTVIDPMIDRDRWVTGDSVDRIADELADAAATAATFGLGFGYHNHAWELSSRMDGGSALERLASRLPESVALEVDAYWAAQGGEDVPALLERLGPRVRFLHVKDAPLAPDGTISPDTFDQLPVGEGALPWTDILAAAPATELVVVEFDEFRGDVFDAAVRSRAALEALGARA
ncbi:MAG TPA: sugar phosphate isomerase/epimerase [Microbacterium sp.]|uniref:sugar phosphate isomerase/epimerase family protein n=1 Tax=Microbacterium sp. TaxID=51671 RepID=UPI002B660EE2|nr:sugar phosphate isomerase/epimerase [Microbacterium sp.]HWI31865.1 sugar phosphate isomerase/epimerase [Microbacterium sp.]